jgi:hypoxanthine phosphoribosyltransferase
MEASAHRLASNIAEILVTEEQIRRRVRELGREIETSIGSPELTLVVLLHGSILFAADLMRALSLPLYLESIRIASYHGGITSSGRLSVESACLDHLGGKDVLIVDDILDTGRTLAFVTDYLRRQIGVRSVHSCVLLEKSVPRSVACRADYVGFQIGNEFVIGYGLDFRGQYRNLPFIGTLKPAAIASAPAHI